MAAAQAETDPNLIHEELWGHPKALWLLFVTEMWERFSYYGMRALLIFYMTQNFLFGDDKSYAIYGSYTSLVYLAPVFGGIVADRILGHRKAVTIGAIFMAAGHFCMAVQTTPVFYLALALLIVGNGFFKPNMSTIIGKLYAPGDERRDSAYTIFYMGVNVGALLSPIGCGLVGAYFGLHWGFTLAGVGMVLGLLVFLRTQDRLKGIADPPQPDTINKPVMVGLSREQWVYIGGLVAVGLMWLLIQAPGLVGWTLLILGGGIFVYVLVYSFVKCESIARHRLWVALIMTGFGIIFWAFFEQAGSSLNLFADRNVNKFIGSWEMPATLLQSVNPIFIVIFGAPLAWLWLALGRRHRNPSTPIKFGLGILQLGLGFAALYYGASISQEDGIVALSWLILGYLLHTTGELFLSPVGLSMISKLAPANMGAMMMGVWYLSSAFAQYAAGFIAQLTSVSGEGLGSEALNPIDTVMVYGNVFGGIAVTACGVGAFLVLISPLIRKGMHGVN
jgi:POT family proton-dependent oligopeptide transporter